MGKDSINCAETLNNLGNVYSRMGKSEDAILYYKRCLLIEEKVKGKQYIDYAMILHNIGLIFFNEYNYE
jgi:tetratricopeptide (TPR) repeat protein